MIRNDSKEDNPVVLLRSRPLFKLPRLKRNIVLALQPVMLILLLSACATMEQEELQFRTIGEIELHAQMRNMADSLITLAQHNTLEPVSESEQQKIVLTELERIQSIATSIAPDDAITNYSVINQYMGAFLYDVELAKSFANREPPNLVPANRLIKSCLSCHSSI